MTSRGPLLALIFALVPVVVFAVLLFATTRDPARADFELLPLNPGGPVGVAQLQQEDDRLEGRIVVWGLGPGSRHLVHLRGPGAACRPEGAQRAPRALALPELVADPNGVAFARVRARAEDDVVEPGHLLMVFAGPGAARANTRVACGDLFDGGAIGAAALASVGPGAGARAEVSTIIQLRGGRPIGGPQRIAARAGERVALAIRSDLPDEVTIAGLGLTNQVGPETIARFSFVPARPGRFELRARIAPDEPVAILDVRTARP
jgi:hypothetical protein